MVGRPTDAPTQPPMHSSALIDAPACKEAPAPSCTRPLPKFVMRSPRVGSLNRMKGAPRSSSVPGQSTARLVSAAMAPVFSVLPSP